MHRRNLSDQTGLRYSTSFNVMTKPEITTTPTTPAGIRNFSFSNSAQASHDSTRMSINSSSADDRSLKQAKRETRLSYKEKKKQASVEVRQVFLNQDMTIISGWLRLRNTLKNWVKLFCVVKPGLFLVFRSDKVLKSHNWVGTVMLTACQLIERPSTKNGFCFKIFHPLSLNFWAKKGPRGENMGNLKGAGLPSTYLIIRAEDELTGKGWLDSLSFARASDDFPWSSLGNVSGKSEQSSQSPVSEEDRDSKVNTTQHSPRLEASDSGVGGVGGDAVCVEDVGDTSDMLMDSDEIEEMHFKDLPDVADGYESDDDPRSSIDHPQQTVYVPKEEKELANEDEDTSLDQDSSIIWQILNQLRAGIDLSHISLPVTFFEPQSLLSRFSNYFIHCDILENVVAENDPFLRMMGVLKFYISGFYKKPKGVKKPFNPVLGEVFRCYWTHKNNSKTFFIAECVSHHPPILSFHATNREVGFSASATVQSSTKYYGNSLAAVFSGNLHVLFHERNEGYTIEIPYMLIRGILVGTMTVEYSGKVKVNCDKTGYSAEINYMVRPLFGNGERLHEKIEGKVRFGKKAVASFEGKYTGEINWSKLGSKVASEKDQPLWKVDEEVRKLQLPCFLPSDSDLMDNESTKVWKNAIAGLLSNDVETGEKEKQIVEDRERQSRAHRRTLGIEHVPVFFEAIKQADDKPVFLYKYRDERPWDPSNDVTQYEKNGIIATHTRINTPAVRSVTIQRTSTTVQSKMPDASNSKKSSRVDVDSSSDVDLNRTGESSRKSNKTLYKESKESLKILENSLRDLKLEMKTLTATLERNPQKDRSFISSKQILQITLATVILVLISNAFGPFSTLGIL